MLGMAAEYSGRGAGSSSIASAAARKPAAHRDAASRRDNSSRANANSRDRPRTATMSNLDGDLAIPTSGK